jgi:hypothetical protein
MAGRLGGERGKDGKEGEAQMGDERDNGWKGIHGDSGFHAEEC